MSTRRLSIRNEEGKVQTAALAALVGIMIAAAAVALILLSFTDSSSNSNGNQPANQAAAAEVTNTPSPTATVSNAPATSTAPSATHTSAKPATKPASTSASKPKVTKPSSGTSSNSAAAASGKPITYTVKRGDNLTVIAAWFHQHGYGKLYDLNKSVIGNNPNLILPGQKITISTAGVSMSH